MCNPYASLVMVLLCSACGSTFAATGASGASGVEPGAGASSGGQSNVAGATAGATAGESSAGKGGVTSAEAGAGGSGAGGSGAGGSGAGGSGAGGSGAGGSGAGGSSAGFGGVTGNPAGGSGGGGVDCVTLIADYAVEVEKARVCDQVAAGAPDVPSNQCSATSTLAAVGCFCPVLVNATSEHTTLAQEKYKLIQANHCDVEPACNNVCSQYGGVGCGPSSTGTSYVCTGLTTVTAN